MTEQQQTKGDIRNIPLIDPTANVLEHEKQAVKRIDDLRDAEIRRLDDLRKAANKRNDDLRAAESRRVDEEASMRENHTKELREAEVKRIDAIRAVDVNAVLVASERANAQAAVLADQLAKSNESNRMLVQSMQTASSAQVEALTKSFNERVGQIEKAQYESKGKSGVTDPIFNELLIEVKSLRTIGATHSGENTGATTLGDWVIRVVLFVLALAGFGIAIFKQ